MNPISLALISTALLAMLPFSANAQTSSQPNAPKKPDSSLEAPSDREMDPKRDPSTIKAPKQSGMVIVPPATDSGAVITPPRNIDPGITTSPDAVKGDGSRQWQEKYK